MNKLIKEQLNKCNTARLPKFDDDTTHLLIKKYEPVSVLVGGCYIIEISVSVLNPTTNSLLASNWNNGSIPKHTHYKCEVEKILGSMIKINGLAYNISTATDINEMWSGWLPLDGIEIIEKL